MKAAAPADPDPTREDKYGIYDLPVGGSKFIPVPKGGMKESVRRAVHQHAKRNHKKFVSRTRTEGGVVGVKVWRRV